ncbi:cilia- and flagella- associated protein 210-like [Hetaerina americana]|uniref:cilia- and flagella- associated protein 210-like n=1 Tax=Hetaerina americana TaxID=62018 RepID=UPI003A7F3E06
MCKGAIEYQDEFGMVKRQPALFMNASYFNNLRKYATEEDKEIAELNRNERLKDLKNSKALSKDWWDTPENLRRTKEEKKLKQKKKYEEDSERIFREMEIANRESERKTLANAKVLKFKERPDMKELLGACLLAEVLNEQAAQINFNEKIKRCKEERDKKYHEDEMKINFEFLQKEAEKITEKRKVNLKYGKELLEQINSRHKLELEEEQERKERERKFFASLSQMKNDDSKERRKEEYIQSLKNDELADKVFEEERQRDNEMEDNHIKTAEVFLEAEEELGSVKKRGKTWVSIITYSFQYIHGGNGK